MEDTVLQDPRDISFIAVNTKNKLIGKLVLTFIICFLATLFAGIVTMLMSVYLPVTIKDLLGNVSEQKLNNVSAWINCVFIFGWMFGGVLWGLVSDKIGRSASVGLSVTLFGLFSVLTGLSSSWLLVSICRFLCGIGVGGLLVSSAVFASELWSEKTKAIVLGMISLAMPVGFFAAGAINNITENWRTAFWIGIIPLTLGVVGYFFLPESEKWKASKARANHSSNAQIFSASNKRNLLLGSIVFGSMLIGLWAVFSWAPTWAQSISSANEAQQQRGSVMMMLAGGGIAGSFCSGWIVNSIGLRKTMLFCFAGCFIMTFLVFKLNDSVSPTTFAELALLAFFFGISQGALSVYIPSLFPVNICASATGFCFNVGRLFTGTVVFFIGALETLLGGYGNAVFSFSFVFILGFIATWIDKREKNIQSS